MAELLSFLEETSLTEQGAARRVGRRPEEDWRRPPAGGELTEE